MRIYAIFDRPAEQYIGALMSHKTDAVALRWFGDEVRNPQSQLHQHPRDYVLTFIGVFDEDTGSVQCPEFPVMLVDGHEVLTTDLPLLEAVHEA